MKDVAVRITAAEQVQIQSIVVDKDKDGAVAFLKLLCDRIEASEKQGLRSHLDK